MQESSPLTFKNEDEAEKCLSIHRSKPYLEMSLQELLSAAHTEREGVQWTKIKISRGYMEDKGYDWSNNAPEEGKWHEEQISVKNILLEGSKNEKRYEEICEVIAARLIFPQEKKEIEAFKAISINNNPPDVRTKENVYNLIEKKYEKSVEDVAALSKHYPDLESEDRKKLVIPLATALGCSTGENIKKPNLTQEEGKVDNEFYLHALRNYTEKLLEPTSRGNSIANQLKKSGDPIAIKILKGIIFTLGSIFIYGAYALHQAIKGEPIKGMDNAGESLVKNAEKSLSLKENRYEPLFETGRKDRPENKGDPEETPEKDYDPPSLIN